MARFLVATVPGAGHVGPLRPIARALVAAGHEVCWCTGRSWADAVRETGASFAPMSHEVDLSDPARGGGRGLKQLAANVEELFIDPVPGQVADLRAVAERVRPAALVSDVTLLAAGAFAELTGTVWASVGVSALPVPSRDTAPFGTGLPPSSSPLGRLRNRGLDLLLTRVVLRDVVAHDTAVRASLGLPPRSGPLTAGISPHLHLQNGVAEFEYPRSDLPPQVHFLGALTDPPRTTQPPPWWPEVVSGERPVVHVTQGTVRTERLTDLVVPTMRALAGRDVLVVATTGGADPAVLGPVPANARVAAFVDHDLLLPHVSAMVTNGGYGAVQRALARGVPLVVAGTTEDKPEVAARVAWSGAGIRLRGRAPSERALERAVGRVLAEPRFRSAAQRLAASHRGCRPEERAVQLLEALVAAGPAVPRTR